MLNVDHLRGNMGQRINLVEKDGVVHLTAKCFLCKKEVVMQTNTRHVELYQAGAFVQDAFPDLNPGERELFLSGMCNDCFDRSTKEPDDIDPETGS